MISLNIFERMSVWQWLAAAMLGLGAAYGFLGLPILDGQNLAWMMSDDPVAHFLSWSFFRVDEWRWPLGLNPRYGMEISSSIVYGDVIPVMALLFKPFNAGLPETFQYFGLWAWFCLVAQAAGGWALAARFDPSWLVRGSVAVLVCFMPAMLARIGGHLALFGHFVLLWSVIALIDQSRGAHSRKWTLLLPLAALMHPYLFVMTLLLFLCAVLNAAILARTHSVKTYVKNLFVPLTVSAMACVAAGYFVGEGSSSSSGFGLYRMNLFSLVDSNGWSRWLPNLDDGPGDYEGFAYLGAGFLILLVLAMVCLGLRSNAGWWRSRSYKLPLLLALACTAFALSNQIGIGKWQWTYPLPEFVLNLAGVFRSSGRFFWPVLYLMLAACLCIVVRSLPRPTLVLLFPVLATVQIYDLMPGLGGYHSALVREKREGIAQPLRDERWAALADHYQRLRSVPAGQIAPNWQALADVSRRFQLETDAAYLARVPYSAVAALQEKVAQTRATGLYDRDTLYVLNEEAGPGAAVSLARSGHWLGQLDGFCVLAPYWLERVGNMHTQKLWSSDGCTKEAK